MNRIRLLPEQVANQIAAGEVVERPASVVKELVENAIDADARRIAVEIQAGGRSLIRVIDDGIGMNRDDALLCLERHATSKIRKAEDLSAIDTMGFRGEALPSIASVSRLSLITRERDGDQDPNGATQIIINGGKIIDVKAAGSPAGTTIEVRQLFFNLPARRKFLRSEETEYGHVFHYLTLAALAYPAVAFTLVKDGRMVWQLPGLGSPSSTDDPEGRLAGVRERMRSLMGSELELLPMNFTGALEDLTLASRFDAASSAPAEEEEGKSELRVWGFVGKPGISRSTREDQHLFVNRRPIENRGLNFALMEGYHTALMKGRYPVCCLFLEIDPGIVDVNIHPAKREVKFRNERAVRQLITQAVREVLLGYHADGRDASVEAGQIALPEAKAQPPKTPEPLESGPSLFPLLQRTFPKSGAAPPEGGSPISSKHSMAPGVTGPGAHQAQPEAASLPAVRPQTGSTSTSVPKASISQPASGRSEGIEPHRSTLPASSEGVTPKVPQPLLNVPLRLVGVIGKLYVVLESDRGLVLLDQHAAHERILFEQMLDRMEKQGNAPSQRLLLPETIELSARDSQFVRELLPTLTRLGVGLNEFGDRTFLLDALPPFVKVTNARRFVLELVDELKAAGQEVNSMRLGEHTVAKTVCRHAVKANDPLAGPELENLVNDLRLCAMPYTCPHGRPTLLEMNYRELEKKFGRQQ